MRCCLNKINDSFFADIYTQAFQAVHSIDLANKRRIPIDESLQLVNDIQNVIAFTGRRGTGKTSTMLTFANALSCSTENILKTQVGLDKCEFYTLPYIDASLLEKNEDLFIVVISKMLHQLNEIERKLQISGTNESRHGHIEDIRRQINDVYNQYVDLKGDQQYSEASSYQVLMKNANKYNIRESFGRLIKSYISIWSESYNLESECPYYSNRISSKYIVICIDDVDMVRGDVMEVMNCIYTYFMLQNIIVLTTVNIKSLTKLVEKYCYNNLNYHESKEGEYFSKTAKEQANDYLHKIISSDMRIVMPSWKKNDYREFIEMKVDLINKGQKISDIQEKFPEIRDGHIINYIKKELGPSLVADKDVSISPKHLTMLMLADRTGIYLDTCGFKSHFMEPTSLRNMMDLFYMFYNMKNPRINTDGTKYFKYTENNVSIFQQNIKISMDYFYFKLLPELCMSNEEEDVFNKFYTEVLTRRAKRIIIFYKQKLEEMSKDKISLTKYKDDEIALLNEYSYGELFRVIHHATRLNILSKSMIKAILACYSFILPRIFDEYIVDYLEQRRNHLFQNGIHDDAEYEKLTIADKCEKLEGFEFKDNLNKLSLLYQVFGSNLLGNWRYNLFGRKKLKIKISAASSPSNNTITNLKELAQQPDIYKYDSNNPIENESLKELLKLEHENPTVHLVYLLMFYPHDYNDPKEHINIEEKELAPTAFVINVSRYKEFFDWLKKGNIEPKIGDEFDDASNYVKSRIERYVLSQRYPHFVLPIHQTDMIYNVIKRSLGDIIYETDDSIETRQTLDNAYEIIEKLFNNIKKELEREDKVYSYESRSITFKELFISCPVVQHFMNIYDQIDKENNNNNNKFIELILDGSNNTKPNEKSETNDSKFSLTANINIQGLEQTDK